MREIPSSKNKTNESTNLTTAHFTYPVKTSLKQTTILSSLFILMCFACLSSMNYASKAVTEPLFIQIITYAFIVFHGIMALSSFYFLCFHLIGKEEIYLHPQNGYFMRKLFSYGVKRNLGPIEIVHLEDYFKNPYEEAFIWYLVSEAKLSIRNDRNSYSFGSGMSNEQSEELLRIFHCIKGDS